MEKNNNKTTKPVGGTNYESTAQVGTRRSAPFKKKQRWGVYQKVGLGFANFKDTRIFISQKKNAQQYWEISHGSWENSTKKSPKKTQPRSFAQLKSDFERDTVIFCNLRQVLSWKNAREIYGWRTSIADLQLSTLFFQIVYYKTQLSSAAICSTINIYQLLYVNQQNPVYALHIAFSLDIVRPSPKREPLTAEPDRRPPGSMGEITEQRGATNFWRRLFRVWSLKKKKGMVSLKNLATWKWANIADCQTLGLFVEILLLFQDLLPFWPLWHSMKRRLEFSAHQNTIANLLKHQDTAFFAVECVALHSFQDLSVTDASPSHSDPNWRRPVRVQISQSYCSWMSSWNQIEWACTWNEPSPWPSEVHRRSGWLLHSAGSLSQPKDATNSHRPLTDHALPYGLSGFPLKKNVIGYWVGQWDILQFLLQETIPFVINKLDGVLQVFPVTNTSNMSNGTMFFSTSWKKQSFLYQKCDQLSLSSFMDTVDS